MDRVQYGQLRELEAELTRKLEETKKKMVEATSGLVYSDDKWHLSGEMIQVTVGKGAGGVCTLVAEDLVSMLEALSLNNEEAVLKAVAPFVTASEPADPQGSPKSDPKPEPEPATHDRSDKIQVFVEDCLNFQKESEGRIYLRVRESNSMSKMKVIGLRSQRQIGLDQPRKDILRTIQENIGCSTGMKVMTLELMHREGRTDTKMADRLILYDKRKSQPRRT